MERARFEPAQTTISRNSNVKSRQKGGTQDRRRKKEGIQNGPQKIKVLPETHRQGIAGTATMDKV
jgi:hypothetical protein